MTPVGGLWAIDAKVATEVGKQLKAKVIFPMHFRNARCNYPVSTVDDFLNDKKNIVISNSSEIELKAGKLPAETQIMVLKPAL